MFKFKTALLAISLAMLGAISGYAQQAIIVTPSVTQSAAITPGVGGSGVSNLVLKGAPGNLYNAYVTTGNTAGWLMIFNATSAPADGSTTAGTAAGNMQDCIPVASNSTASISFSPGPAEAFSTGITLVFSSTT